MCKVCCSRLVQDFEVILLKQVVYILDQVRALEEELLLRFNQQGLNVKPQILVVSYTRSDWEVKAMIFQLRQYNLNFV